MIIAALLLGVFAWLFLALGSAINVFDTKKEFEKGVGCIMLPLSLAVAGFIVASLFILY